MGFDKLGGGFELERSLNLGVSTLVMGAIESMEKAKDCKLIFQEDKVLLDE